MFIVVKLYIEEVKGVEEDGNKTTIILLFERYRMNFSISEVIYDYNL